MSSLELFENIEQTDESTRITAAWLRDENLETALPNPPKITTGKVVAHENASQLSNAFVGSAGEGYGPSPFDPNARDR